MGTKSRFGFAAIGAFAIAGLDFLFDWIGRSTAPEDWVVFVQRLGAVVNALNAIPWLWPVVGVVLLLAWALYPQSLSQPNTHASTSRRVPISEIRKYAMKMGWTLDDKSSVSTNDSYELTRRLRQSVIDGEQPLWGRLRIMPGTGSSPLVHENLPEHLKAGQINPYSFRVDLPNEQTGTSWGALLESKVGVTYDDLHVDLAKAKAWLKRNRKPK